MTAAVSSPTAATYVAPAATAAQASDTDPAVQASPAATTTAASVASVTNLSPDTVAALVAQQTTDPSAATPITPAGTPPSSTSSAWSADVFAGASDLVQQVQHYASLLVDGSGASDTAKATAMAQLYQLRFKVGGSATDPSKDHWFTQSTAAQRQVVDAEIDDSSFFKQGIAAASRFNATGMGLARAGDRSASSSESARFSQLSTQQQTLIWAGGFSQFQSLDDFKSYLAEQAAGNAAMQAAIGQGDAASAGRSGTRTTGAPVLNTPVLNAPVLNNAAPASDDPATKAAKSLLATGPGVSMADVALSLLQNSASAQATADDDEAARAKTGEGGNGGLAAGKSTTADADPASRAAPAA